MNTYVACSGWSTGVCVVAMQAVAAAESTASLLGDEVDKLKKEASQKLSDAVRPLQKRVEKLESSAKARVCAPFLGTATMPARHFL